MSKIHLLEKRSIFLGARCVETEFNVRAPVATGFTRTVFFVTFQKTIVGSWSGGRSGRRSRGRSGRRARGRAGRGTGGRSRGRAGGGGTGGVTGGLRNTAHVFRRGGGTSGQQDVPVQAPRGTPRIFHFPVHFAVQSTVPDRQDTVVKCGAAPGVVKHTGFVKLKGTFVGFDGHGHGANGDGGLQGIFVFLWHVGVAGQSDGRGASGLAGTVGRRVRVVGFGAETAVAFDVGKGVVHETTVATLVTFFVAIDQHLFTQRHQFAGGNGVGTFGGTRGGEGPATAALALVFDGGDGVLFAPIDGGRGGVHDLLAGQSMVDVLGATQVTGFVVDAGVKRREFFPRHVGEFIVANGGRVSFGVVVLDKDIVGFERFELGIDLCVGVLFVEEFHPRLETSAGFDFVVCAVKGERTWGREGEEGGTRWHEQQRKREGEWLW